jgi:hypothetical protein
MTKVGCFALGGIQALTGLAEPEWEPGLATLHVAIHPIREI